jgi:hypothetical protein
MRGGAPLDMAEMERVSALFDVEKIGGAITGGLRDGSQEASGPMGELASLHEIQDLTVSRLQVGGKRSRKQKRRGRGRGRTNRKPRFRLNLRASIRWHR